MLGLVGEPEGADGLLHVSHREGDARHHGDEAVRLQALLQHLGEGRVPVGDVDCLLAVQACDDPAEDREPLVDAHALCEPVSPQPRSCWSTQTQPGPPG